MIPFEKQTTFHWSVAVYLFLSGSGAGLFLLSYGLSTMGRYPVLTGVGALLGPVIVIIGLVFVFAEHDRKQNFYRLANNPASWMSRGTWFASGFVLCGLAYAAPSLLIEWGVPLPVTLDQSSMFGRVLGGLTAGLAVLVAIYTGFFFGVLKRIPLWYKSGLPMLFFSSSLYTGMALLLVLYPFFPENDSFLLLVKMEIGLILIQMITMASSMGMAMHGGAVAVASVRLLLQPFYLTGVGLAGLILPLVLLGIVSSQGSNIILSVIAGLLILFGGLLHRFGVVYSGLRLPVL